ncbi:MAG TPA: gamma-glutamyltransferase [Puia sp.]|uniref:gamma-glutamyltransferase n=1 Tax=Puia sp. TaxID=2045100 RepID=UPI002D0EBCE0|nr:gamma-glutamyltransferase [Puia sp.]HVU97025.1 gamma-glutamyltransferase [Puia sp.]
MRQPLIRSCVLCTLIFAAAYGSHAQAQADPYHYSIRKTVVATHGAVVSAHPLASSAGLAILRQGGNAFDAAITTQLALAVVYPAAGNIGGGGFMVAHTAKGRNITLDYREKAPAAATRDMYLDAAGNARTDLSQNGHLASGVPGVIAGIFAELKYARLPLAKLIQPAIDLAQNGFAITAAEARGLNSIQSSLKKYCTVTPVFVREGGWKQGDTLVQEDLAKTLRLIRDNGAKGFYEGETARLILEEMQRGKGIISAADLKRYTAKERTPSVFPYRQYTVVTMPLPSSGGVVLQQMLKMVEDMPLASYGFESLKAVHLMTEVERLAYADRAEYLGDRDFYSVPVDTLTSKPYLLRRMSAFQPDKAGSSKEISAGLLTQKSEETTHFETIDDEGNAVSITTTLNGGYGCRVVVGGAGFFLNNEMDDFSVKPGVPNMYGAVGNEANAIAPGKRMLSSMTPTIVLAKGKPYLVTGTPGGTTITTSVFQTLVDIIDFGLSAEDAVNRPKFHHQWLPDELFVEAGFPAGVQEQLKAMGYTVTLRGSIGRTELIRITPDHKIEAVGDNRGDDTAEGY